MKMMENGNGYIENLYRIMRGGGYQRTLHYHNTPRFYDKLYEEQISYIACHYHTVGMSELEDRLFGRTEDQENKPSMVIGLFDGYRNHYDVIYPILERYGMTAWFLLVADFLDTPADEQEGRLEQYKMQYLLGEYKDRRYAMDWEEARQAAQNHVIVNHSSTHFYLTPDTGEKELKYEILHSHELIMKNTGITPKAFSWLGGGEFATNPAASEILRKMGYEYLIGYELENICREQASRRDGQGIKWKNKDLTVDCLYPVPDKISWDQQEKIQEEIHYHQKVMDSIGIFSAVPAILPLYRAELPSVHGEKEEDAAFAIHFYQLSMYLRERLKISEWEAAHRALDIMAVNMIGEGFPYHI